MPINSDVVVGYVLNQCSAGDVLYRSSADNWGRYDPVTTNERQWTGIALGDANNSTIAIQIHGVMDNAEVADGAAVSIGDLIYCNCSSASNPYDLSKSYDTESQLVGVAWTSTLGGANPREFVLEIIKSPIEVMMLNYDQAGQVYYNNTFYDKLIDAQNRIIYCNSQIPLGMRMNQHRRVIVRVTYTASGNVTTGNFYAKFQLDALRGNSTASTYGATPTYDSGYVTWPAPTNPAERKFKTFVISGVNNIAQMSSVVCRIQRDGAHASDTCAATMLIENVAVII